MNKSAVLASKCDGLNFEENPEMKDKKYLL